jgi:hypothetical protein
VPIERNHVEHKKSGPTAAKADAAPRPAQK